ncbi:MAG: hypothetical protein AB7F79_02210 [Steroidobacteraceae bacterium]
MSHHDLEQSFRHGLWLASLVLLAACTTAPDHRPTHSSYGCMQAVRLQVPATLDDKQQHCLASALIAQQCSVMEAYLAGMGKELSDLFGAGDAEWADWQADRTGIACAKNNDSHEAIADCCQNPLRQ